MQYQTLISELKTTVEDLAIEAQQGDEQARAWLVQSFPGHTLLFLKSWPETTPAASRPALTRPRSQRGER